MGRQLPLTDEPGAVELRGTVVRFLHVNEDSGWAVALFDTEADTIRAVGTFLGIQAGESLRLVGSWVEHPKFGRQLRVASFEPVEPASLDGIEAYLASFIDGITKRLVKKIVRHFGETTLDVLATEPDRLIEVHGIGKKRKQRIVESWQKARQVREVMVFLQSYGIPAALAARIFRHFGDRTLDAVRDDPYCLMEVRGSASTRPMPSPGRGESLPTLCNGSVPAPSTCTGVPSTSLSISPSRMRWVPA